MKVWCIWMQEEQAEYIWLEAAWCDEQTAENHDGWTEEVNRCRKLAFENKYEMRIQAVEVPGVYDLFDIPSVKAKVAI
jgi:hypothetical protein